MPDLTGVFGNAVSVIVIYLLLNLPVYLYLKRKQTVKMHRRVAGLYFRYANLGMLLHLFTLALPASFLTARTEGGVVISVFYFMFLCYAFASYHVLSKGKDDTEKRDAE